MNTSFNHFNKNENLWHIWEQLYRSRELEISTQWQRVIFLSSFIILTLTGNSILFYNVFCAIEPVNISIIHIYVGLFLGLLLLFCGAMWLAMTKGSKYWMNVYERKIDLIELQLNFENDYKQFRYLEEKYNDDTATTAADGKVYTPGQPLVNTEGFLGAKAISPSKTNILIGYLLVALSIFFSIFYAIEILKIIKIKDFISFDTLCNAVAVIAISVIYFGMAYCILKVLRHHD